MPYTPMSDLGQQGLFDITRTLLQQPDLSALSDALTRLVRQSAPQTAPQLCSGIAERNARATTQRVIMAKRLNTKMKRIWRMVRCAAFSPVRKPCTAILRSSGWRGRGLPGATSISLLATTACCRWRRRAISLAAASSSARPTGPGAKRSTSVCTPLPRLWPWWQSRSKVASPITWITTC